MRRAFAELNKHPITIEMGSNARDLCCKPECSQETLSVPRSCHVTTRQFTVGNWAEPPDNWDNSCIERFIISNIKRYIPSKYNPFQLSCSLKIPRAQAVSELRQQLKEIVGNLSLEVRPSVPMAGVGFSGFSAADYPTWL